jgi:hypothetical protein
LTAPKFVSAQVRGVTLDRPSIGLKWQIIERGVMKNIILIFALVLIGCSKKTLQEQVEEFEKETGITIERNFVTDDCFSNIFYGFAKELDREDIQKFLKQNKERILAKITKVKLEPSDLVGESRTNIIYLGLNICGDGILHMGRSETTQLSGRQPKTNLDLNKGLLTIRPEWNKNSADSKLYFLDADHHYGYFERLRKSNISYADLAGEIKKNTSILSTAPWCNTYDSYAYLSSYISRNFRRGDYCSKLSLDELIKFILNSP